MKRVGWSFWRWWVLATTVGWVVAFPIADYMDQAVGNDGEGAAILGFAVAATVGAVVVGALQWLVLRWRLSRAGWWVLANIGGFAVGVPVGLVANLALVDTMPAVAWMEFGAVVGAVVGVMQWLILRRQLSRAGWWVLANIVGWVVATAMLISMTEVFGAVGGVAAVAAQGAITGGALVWLLRQPLPDSASAA